MQQCRETTLPSDASIGRLVSDAGFRYPRAVVEQKLAELVGRDIRESKHGRVGAYRVVEHDQRAAESSR